MISCHKQKRKMDDGKLGLSITELACKYIQ